MIKIIRDALLRAKDDEDKCLGNKGVYTHYVYELEVKVVSIVITHSTPSDYRVFQSDHLRRKP
jgi:hypothetical protein